MMVYGLNLDKVNPDRLFNIFCLYGNVVRVSFEITHTRGRQSIGTNARLFADKVSEDQGGLCHDPAGRLVSSGAGSAEFEQCPTGRFQIAARVSHN